MIITTGLISFTTFQSDTSIVLINEKSDFTRHFICRRNIHFDSQFIFLLILSLFCAIQGFRSRNLPSLYNETTKIAYSMYTIIVIIMTRFPIIYSLSEEYQNITNAMIITLINSCLMLITFSSNTYDIIFHPEVNTKEYFQKMMMQHAKEKTDMEMKRTQINDGLDEE